MYKLLHKINTVLFTKGDLLLFEAIKDDKLSDEIDLKHLVKSIFMGNLLFKPDHIETLYIIEMKRSAYLSLPYDYPLWKFDITIAKWEVFILTTVINMEESNVNHHPYSDMISTNANRLFRNTKYRECRNWKSGACFFTENVNVFVNRKT
ncbi:hypothetical protein CDIK_0534 [Cucumispora dikerogammari]|nr:hypothetical protein CDIK_0534 [Cucumispora dikerogammari]